MAYECGHEHCTKDVTTRVRMRNSVNGIIGHADLCGQHADELTAAALEIAPGTTVTCAGKIKVTEDGEEINEGSVH